MFYNNTCVHAPNYMHIPQIQSQVQYVCICMQIHTTVCPTVTLLGMDVSVLALQSTTVNITISGRGEVYNCTLNNMKVNITSGQPVLVTGLAPNTTYTINCHSVDDSCLEEVTTFTTGMLTTLYTQICS